MSKRFTGSADGRPMDAAQIEANFGDIHPALSETQAMAESSRCLYCYDAPCVTACPTSIDIPKFIHQISTGNITGSAKTILSSNIMGGTCARVCPTEVLCEGSCVKNATGEEPVKIGQLQRHAVDGLMEMNVPHPFFRAASTGKKIAVIGAGPAGLSCAHRSAMAGHDVTVFEAKPKAGGLNEYGLAAYKMVDDFAQREVDFLLEIGGISIEYDKALGGAISLESLKAEFDAVFIGVGLGDVNALGLEGEDKKGVESAINFIEELRQADKKTDVNVGDNVVVIGGGNTAIDAAVQAKRLGASDVTLVYRRGAEQMTATEWEQDLAQVNGVNIRLWSKPVGIKGNGKVEGMSFERTMVDGGKLVGTGKTYELPADQVLKAIGQVLETGPLAGLEIDGGKIKIGDDYQTSIAGVFAGGDCIKTGEDLTVQSVDDGAKAAEAMTRFLSA
ncbi:NAD(P)-dependent oxidoreductase [Curvivirga sp.]|uniref:NAD(P)-dependent oxidoreductase n=1 Tax=Curvivirga sp. TaxID=2856848 RepID=UPI003B5C4320